MITKIMSMKTTRIVTKNILLLLLILPSGCTQRARAQFREPKFPQNLPQFWDFHEDIFSLCEYKLSLYFLSPLRGGRKFIAFLGTFVLHFPKKRSLFWFFFLLPSQRTTGQMQHVDHGRSGARFPLSPSRPPASYCPCLPSFCAIVSVLFLTRTSAGLPACCTRLLPHTLCLLP